MATTFVQPSLVSLSVCDPRQQLPHLLNFLLQNFKAAIRGQPVEGRISNQHYLHSYLTYLRLTKTVDRNLLLIENLKNYLPGKQVEEGRKITKPQDLVRLYDIMIQVSSVVQVDNKLKDHIVILEVDGIPSPFWIYCK